MAATNELCLKYCSAHILFLMFSSFNELAMEIKYFKYQVCQISDQIQQLSGRIAEDLPDILHTPNLKPPADRTLPKPLNIVKRLT